MIQSSTFFATPAIALILIAPELFWLRWEQRALAGVYAHVTLLQFILLVSAGLKWLLL